MGDFVGKLPRFVVGHAFPLEQHHQLGQLLGGVFFQFASLALDLGPLHVLLGAGAEEGSGAHGNHAGESARETGDDDGGLALDGHGDAGDQGDDAQQAVLGAEYDLAQPPQAGDSPALPVNFGGGGVVGLPVEGPLGGGRSFRRAVGYGREGRRRHAGGHHRDFRGYRRAGLAGLGGQLGLETAQGLGEGFQVAVLPLHGHCEGVGGFLVAFC